MEKHRKLGNPRGVASWKRLQSTGDVRRFVAWCIHSLRDGTLDRQTASVMGQLGCYLMRAVEGDDIEKRLEALEQAVQGSGGGQPL